MKVRKSYRLNSFVVDFLNEIKKKTKINETSLIEMAVIEKCAKISPYLNEKDKVVCCIDEMIKDLEMAQERVKNGCLR